jgi:hypothetical protein
MKSLAGLDRSAAVCRTGTPHCGNVNIMVGFSEMMACTCRECGEVVQLSDDPDIDRIFGPEE